MTETQSYETPHQYSPAMVLHPTGVLQIMNYGQSIQNGSSKTSTGEDFMNEKETRVFKQTRLRNLKRAYAKTLQHSDLSDTAISLKHEIDLLETELN